MSDQMDLDLPDDKSSAADSGDNSVDVENENYLGADPYRQNHAYITDEPFEPSDDDEKELVERQKANEERNSVESLNRNGSTPAGVHPSDRRVAGAKASKK